MVPPHTCAINWMERISFPDKMVWLVLSRHWNCSLQPWWFRMLYYQSSRYSFLLSLLSFINLLNNVCLKYWLLFCREFWLLVRGDNHQWWICWSTCILERIESCNGLNECGALGIYTSSPGNVVTAWSDADLANDVLMLIATIGNPTPGPFVSILLTFIYFVYFNSFNWLNWDFTTNPVTFSSISSSFAKGIHVDNNKLYLSIQNSIYAVCYFYSVAFILSISISSLIFAYLLMKAIVDGSDQVQIPLYKSC